MLTDEDRRLLTDAADALERADTRCLACNGRMFDCDPKALAAAIRALVDRRRPDLDLDALEKAEQAMSRGPWTLDPTDDDILAPYEAVEHPDGTTGNVVGYLYVEQDFKGILALRNAAPALIAEVRALRAEIARLTGEFAAGAALPVVVVSDDSAAVSLIVAPRWGVRMDDGGEIRWCDSEHDARQNFAQHVAHDRHDHARVPATPAADIGRVIVGGLLITLDEDGDEVIEFKDEKTGAMMQIMLGPNIAYRMWDDEDGWGDELEDSEVQHRWLTMPARLVSAAEADLDPATRGPLGKG